MGISSNFAPIVIDSIGFAPDRGSLLALGRQTLDCGLEILDVMLAQAGHAQVRLDIRDRSRRLS